MRLGPEMYSMTVVTSVQNNAPSAIKVHTHNRCGCQSITQQCLKRCLIKDEVNYMFRPHVAIIRFSSESMVVVLYRIGMGMSRW